MLNHTISEQLVYSLALIKPLLTENEYKVLFYKWGGTDGKWHSVKGTIKDTGVVVGLSQVEELERKTIKLIQDKKREAFCCPACGSDVRKIGLNRIVEGKEHAKHYIDDDGIVTRITDARFEAQKESSFMCLKCYYAIPEKTPLGYVLTHGLKRRDVVQAFAKKYINAKGNIKHPTVKTKKRFYEDIVNVELPYLAYPPQADEVPQEVNLEEQEPAQQQPPQQEAPQQEANQDELRRARDRLIINEEIARVEARAGENRTRWDREYNENE